MPDISDRLLSAFAPYEDFCRATIDGYVLVDPSGKIVKINPLFSLLVGKKAKQILKVRSLDELIRFHVNNRSVSVCELLRRRSPTRIDEVRGVTDLNSNLNLILGIYPFFDDDTFLGSYLLIRDVTAETKLQDKYMIKATQSITDKLTGLYNRTYFDQFVPILVADIERREDTYPVSVLMVDIDHFKNINDSYGHQTGDYVIQTVAEVLKANSRKTDTLCRYGGEEFLIIFPETNLEDARIAAEKLRNSIVEKRFEYNKVVMPISISIGVAEIELSKEDPTVAIARADQALYHAKESGRNRVSIHDGTKCR